MTTRRAFVNRAFAVAAVALAPTLALAKGWVVLGRRTVKPGGDHDRIVLDGGRRFDAIRLEVAENGIFINKVHVTFANGKTQGFNIRNFIERGGQTRAIALPGDDRDIQRIDLFFRRRPGGGPAIVTVLGREA